MKRFGRHCIILRHLFLFLQQTRIYTILYRLQSYTSEYSELIPFYSDWKSNTSIKTSNKPVQHVVLLRCEGRGIDNFVNVLKNQICNLLICILVYI